MINAITLKEFKCFASLNLPLAQLTLMTGFNAAGKSSVIQGLLLIAQNLRKDDRQRRLSLAGSLVNLGTAGEVLRDVSGAESLYVGFSSEFAKLGWTLSAGSERNHLSISGYAQGSAVIQAGANEEISGLLPESQFKQDKYRQIIDSLKGIIYISAARNVGLDNFPVLAEQSVNADVGVHGEFAPWLFQDYADENVVGEKRHPNAKNELTLRRQLRAWANDIFPGMDANAVVLGEWAKFVELGLRTDNGNFRRPSNIGYGLSYVFPILIAGLLAQSGQILVIDSPEAHLHPRGQSQMGRFLAHMANAGVQIIVETHSDHLLNGVRLAVKENAISHESVALHFFNSTDPIEGKGPARVISPTIDKNGALDSWPDGFFDQSEKDAARLMGWE